MKHSVGDMRTGDEIILKQGFVKMKASGVSWDTDDNTGIVVLKEVDSGFKPAESSTLEITEGSHVTRLHGIDLDEVVSGESVSFSYSYDSEYDIPA